MKSFKELRIDEVHQEVSADFKVSASGRKIPVQRKNIKDADDVDNDDDVDANDKKTAKMRGEGYRYNHNDNRTGFGKRHREDDEYHVPDPVDNRQTHDIHLKLSKDGGEVQHKIMKVKTLHGAEHAKKFAHSEAEKQGWKVHEEVEIDESIDREDQRLMQLARLGLVDNSDVAKLRTAITQLKSDKVLSLQQRSLLLKVLEDLLSLVTGDDQLFRRVKMDVQKEATEPKDKDDVPFDGPYTKKPSATPGKHGSGYSTARHLARLALQKQQKKQGK